MDAEAVLLTLGTGTVGEPRICEDEPFKQCSLCGTVWPEFRDFVTDPTVRVVGYQPNSIDPELSLILVSHNTPDCHTTLGVRLSVLRGLWDGPQWAERGMGLDGWISPGSGEPRPEEWRVEGEMAWVRQVLEWLRRHELPPHLEPEPEAA
jgi:hypothetical protein